MQNRFLVSTACAGFVVASAVAAPLDLANVSKESKWVIHLDMEAFRKSRLGAHLIDKVIQPKIDSNEQAKKLNLSINLSNISSITAFGPAFEKNGDGVLLIRTTADAKKDLDTLAGMSSVTVGGSGFSMTHLNPYPLYSFQSNLFVAPNIANTVVIAKSKEQIENARQVLLGKGESLAATKSFSEFSARPKGFFFVGIPEGLDEDTQLPAQAQVLKEARGGRLVIGENDDKIFASLAFRGKDSEATTKIQQVFLGIKALMTLSQDNKDVTELANATTIGSEGSNVTIDIQFPIAKAVDQIDAKVN